MEALPPSFQIKGVFDTHKVQHKENSTEQLHKLQHNYLCLHC